MSYYLPVLGLAVIATVLFIFFFKVFMRRQLRKKYLMPSKSEINFLLGEISTAIRRAGVLWREGDYRKLVHRVDVFGGEVVVTVRYNGGEPREIFFAVVPEKEELVMNCVLHLKHIGHKVDFETVDRTSLVLVEPEVILSVGP